MVTTHATQVVIPVKAFDRAKARLAVALSDHERAALARSMATHVVEATGGLATWVVCDDVEVAAWARGVGASVSWQPGRGLNGAVTAAVAERFDDGAARVIVVHSDLPIITSIATFDADSGELVLAPDRHGDGTNVVSTPTPEFRFAYGPMSFERHWGEGRRLGLPTRIVDDTHVGWDVDVPEDLAVFGSDEPAETTKAGAD